MLKISKNLQIIFRNNYNNRLFCTITTTTSTTTPTPSVKIDDDGGITVKDYYIKILNNIRDNYTSKFTQNEIDKYIQLEQSMINNNGEGDDNGLIDFHLGTFYSQGILVEKDNEKALEHFRKSADNNNSKGQFAYGLSLIFNNNTEKLFQPLFPTITNNQEKENQQDNNNDNILIGKGWVSINNENNQNNDKEFNFRKWLKEERKKSISFKENMIKAEINEKERIEKGIRYLNLSAIQNFSIAQFNLGNILLHGRFNVDRNEKQGLYWLEKAANDFDDTNACLELGKFYLSSYSSTGNEDNLISAIKYLIKGSNNGDSECSFLIGSSFINRDQTGNDGDTEQLFDSIKFLKLSIEQGNKNSPAFLALLYLDGVGGVGKKDVNQFNKYLELGVERNDGFACLIMGEQYFKGENGYEQSYKKALHYFTLSSNLGNPDGYINQGVCHFNGYGTNIDYTKAFYCYQNAFNLNNKSIAAISNLSNMYKNGLGVPVSPENSNYFSNLLLKIQTEQQQQ